MRTSGWDDDGPDENRFLSVPKRLIRDVFSLSAGAGVGRGAGLAVSRGIDTAAARGCAVVFGAEGVLVVRGNGTGDPDAVAEAGTAGTGGGVSFLIAPMGREANELLLPVPALFSALRFSLTSFSFRLTSAFAFCSASFLSALALAAAAFASALRLCSSIFWRCASCLASFARSFLLFFVLSGEDAATAAVTGTGAGMGGARSDRGVATSLAWVC